MKRPPFRAPIAVRVFTKPNGKPLAQKRAGGSENLASEFHVVFDTETTLCPAQKLRVGCAQVRKANHLVRELLFYADDLPASDINTVQKYAAAHGLDVCPIAEFRTKVLLKICYLGNGSLVGFNLPFDISRIAMEAGEARGNMRGGFSFPLTPWKSDPHIRVKHLSPSASLIDWAAPGKQYTGRGMRNRDQKVPVNRGSFVDVKTLASAMLTGRYSLKALAEKLNVPTQKLETSEHGGPITFEYLDYLRADVQATWECFEVLSERYAEFELTTPISRILSEASLGKALLEKMGIQPLLAGGWEKVDFSAFGHLLPTYFGGRAEVRIRRQAVEVIHTDFKSMYPTVNALQGLHEFLVADGFETYDATDEVIAFLKELCLEDLQNKATWRNLHVIVEIVPDGDLLPVRAPYAGPGKPYTIGLNYLKAEFSCWYALADLAASKILTGKIPRIRRAIGFRPGPKQVGLQPVNLMGREDCLLDPNASDLFSAIINMRDKAKAAKDPIEKHLKILANSTGYGVYAEIIRDDAPKPEPLTIVGMDGQETACQSKALEEPGRYFHPLLATMITSGARLMLACAEAVAERQDLGWAFCDTDSLAIARPDAMDRDVFEARVQNVIDWFVPLNPYEEPGSILQIEDVNYAPDTKEHVPLYCWAISAKRYALFNIDADGTPIIRKASAHGLGHLMEPYGEDDAAPNVPAPICDLPKIGVKRWQYDLWFHIIKAARSGHPNQVGLDYHSALSKPALMRYGATSPALLRWVKAFNEGKPFSEQIKPFGFMVAPVAKGASDLEPGAELMSNIPRGRPQTYSRPKPVAPFERDPAKAAACTFDRETGEPVPLELLKTYAEVLRLYHLSSEDKFENGGPWDTGLTARRYVCAAEVVLIGKEANKVGDFGEIDPERKAVAKF